MIYVFAGPSISKDRILSRLPECTILPPVKAADLLRLLSDTTCPRPSHVHIIDGFFYSKPSVRHKEIIHCLRQGITVSGCSSMGALRASELDTYGMVGIGRIYEYYSKTPISSDGDVALSHLPDEPYSSLTIPLINIRLSLEDLVNNDELSQDHRDMIFNACSNIHFTERTKKSVENLTSVQAHFPDFVEHIKDWKYIDAVLSLDQLSDLSLFHRQHLSNIDYKTLPGGANLLNYFLDSIFLRNPDCRPVDINDFTQLFDALNLQSALLLADNLAISPSNAQIEACYQFISNADLSGQSYFPVNDDYFKRLYALLVAKLLLLFKSQINHCGLFQGSKIMEDSRVIKHLFSHSFKPQLDELSTSYFNEPSI